MADFRLAGSTLRGHLDGDEAALMRELVHEMKTLLEAGVPRQDPVVARLFPEAYEAHEDQAGYRELVEDELRAKKLHALGVVSDAVAGPGAVDVSLSGEEIDEWLSFLTDLRLAVGTRLNVTEGKMSADIEPDDPEGAALSVLHWLGWIQESILEEMNA